jgi:hypothetical protein
MATSNNSNFCSISRRIIFEIHSVYEIHEGAENYPTTKSDKKAIIRDALICIFIYQQGYKEKKYLSSELLVSDMLEITVKDVNNK